MTTALILYSVDSAAARLRAHELGIPYHAHSRIVGVIADANDEAIAARIYQVVKVGLADGPGSTVMIHAIKNPDTVPAFGIMTETETKKEPMIAVLKTPETPVLVEAEFANAS